LKHEQLYLDNLPSAESYERSYMHRDVITHIVVTKYVKYCFEMLAKLCYMKWYMYLSKSRSSHSILWWLQLQRGA